MIRHTIYCILLFMLCLPQSTLSQGSGQSISFNGVDQAVNLGQTNLDSIRTIEMWFKPDELIDASITEPRALVARDFNNGDRLSIHEFSVSFAPIVWGNAGQIRFARWANRQRGDIVSDSNQWQKDRWYHLAVTIDPTKGMHMYINGVLQQNTSPLTAPIMHQSGSATDNIFLGKWGGLNRRFFKGEMDEVRIWSTARTESEIRDHMCSRIKDPTNELEWYLPFDAGSTASISGKFNTTKKGLYQNFTSNSRKVSGAPIGGTSAHVYPASWSRTSLLLTTDSQTAEVSNLVSQSSGMHIYADGQPNSIAGLSNWRSNGYFGVFFTGAQATYSISLNTKDRCFCQVGARNDNASTPWQQLTTIQEDNCKLVLKGESSVGTTYRSEYIPNNTFRGSRTINLVFCEGDTLTLSADTPSTNYQWSNDSTSASIEIWQQDTYWVKMLKNSCTAIDTFHTRFLSEEIDLGADRYICEEGQLTLTIADTAISSIRWTFHGEVDSSRSFQADTVGLVYFQGMNRCGALFDSIYVSRKTGRTLDTTICNGEVYGAMGRRDATRNEWDDGTIDRSKSIDEEGTYWVRADFPDCAITDTFQITIHQSDRQLNFAGDSFELCKDSSLSLLIVGKDSINVLWEFNGLEYRNRSVLDLNEPGTLKTTLMDLCDTTVREIAITSVHCVCDVDLPNVFTPNADEMNNTFHPEHACDFTSYHFVVYNRWGQCVYETYQEQDAWNGRLDGRECAPSTYFWILTYTSTVNKTPVEQVGTVMLLR